MMAFDLRAIAETSATGIVDCLILGTFVALVGAVLLRLTRRLGADTRFSVGFASLMAIATLPFLEAVWKAHRVDSAVAATNHVAVTLPGSWAIYLFGLWVVLAAIASARVAVGLWHLYRIRRTCLPVASESLDAKLRETLARKQAARKVTLCTSDEVQVPTVIGLFRPTIIVPEWALAELSADELNHILIHELAHLRRWDDWTNLLQQIIKALFFFHPAVWWIERQVSLEREMACDDAVLAETASPQAYAECLAHLAERSFMRRSVALAQAVLGRVHQISRRVAQILDGNRPARAAKTWKVAVPLVGLFAGASVVAVSNGPTLVAFSDPQQNLVSNLRNAPLPDSGVTPFSAPVVPAKFVVSNSTNTNRTVPRKIARSRLNRAPEENPQTLVAHNVPGENHAEGMIHLASVSSDQMISETVVVVFANPDVSSNNQPAYQIRVWRVLLWHPTAEGADQKVSPKI